MPPGTYILKSDKSVCPNSGLPISVKSQPRFPNSLNLSSFNFKIGIWYLFCRCVIRIKWDVFTKYSASYWFMTYLKLMITIQAVITSCIDSMFSKVFLHCCRNVNRYGHYGQQYRGFFLKNKKRSTIRPRNPTTGHIPRGNHNFKRHMHANVPCSTIHNSQDMERT